MNKVLCIHNYYRFQSGEDIMFDKILKNFLSCGLDTILFIDRYKNNNFFQFLKRLIKNYTPYNYYLILSIIKKNKDIKFCYIQNTYPYISEKIIKLLVKNNIKIFFRISNYRFLCPNGLLYKKNQICKLCINSNLTNVIKFNCEKNYLKSLISYFHSKKLRNLIKINEINLIVQTKFQYDFYLNTNLISKNRIYILNNFIENNLKFKDIKIPFKNYFIMTGRDHPSKGFDFIINYFSQQKQYNLIVITNNPNKYKITKNIKYFNYLSREENLYLIKNSNGLIFNSRWLDIFPNILLEAMALNIPILSSSNESLKDILIKNKNCLMFKDNDNDSLFSVLREIQNNQLRNKIINKSKKLIFEKYSKKIFINNLSSIFT